MKEPMMRAAFLDAVRTISVREVPRPSPAPGEVLIRVRSVGVCGSDVHFYEDGRIGRFVVTEPLILGHECAGEVVEVGEGVTTPTVGDRVAVEPGFPCRRCPLCKAGRYNLCPDVEFFGAPPVHGAFREFLTAPADFCFLLPEEVSFEEGALMEPLAVACHGINCAGLRAGERVAVLGAGPIGLVAVAAANAMGAREILAVDVVDFRLDAARRLGATHIVNSKADPEWLGPDRFDGWADLVLECVGVPETIRQSFQVAALGGRVAWIGVGADMVDLPVTYMTMKELAVYGIFRYANAHPMAAALLATRRVDLRPLITHRFDFPQVAEAIEFSRTHRDCSIKTLVNFPD